MKASGRDDAKKPTVSRIPGSSAGRQGNGCWRGLPRIGAEWRERQRPAVFPKELRFATVCYDLVRFTADRGGGFRSKPQLEKQATLVYSGLLRMAKAEAGREALTRKKANHAKGRKGRRKGRKLNH